MTQYADTHVFHGYSEWSVNDESSIDDATAIQRRLHLDPDPILLWNRLSKPPVKPTSQLGTDDQTMRWLNVSQGVNYAFTQAADALTALRALYPEDRSRPEPFSAHYAVARSGLESASLALWILGPDDPRHRLERHMRNIIREVNEEDSYFKHATSMGRELYPETFTGSKTDKVRKSQKKWRAARRKLLTQVSEELGIKLNFDSNVGFATIVREAGEHTRMPGATAEFCWRAISGLSHPSLSRGMSAHNVTITRDVPDSPTVTAVVTNKSDMSRTAIETFAMHFRQALELFRQRKLTPSSADVPAGAV
ncbi:hypothetical protein [Microbacterium halotolerans]|uniref:hypothetical protein n=1 Tax=Microbacterium halotolerans TaxID=246613 RepID=UPI000E6AC665|nr:hypothetical protein [Microbacterium halotolerans]